MGGYGGGGYGGMGGYGGGGYGGMGGYGGGQYGGMGGGGVSVHCINFAQFLCTPVLFILFYEFLVRRLRKTGK